MYGLYTCKCNNFTETEFTDTLQFCVQLQIAEVCNVWMGDARLSL